MSKNLYRDVYFEHVAVKESVIATKVKQQVSSLTRFEKSMLVVIFTSIIILMMSAITTRIKVDQIQQQISQIKQETDKIKVENQILQQKIYDKTSSTYLTEIANQYGLTRDNERIIGIEKEDAVNE